MAGRITKPEAGEFNPYYGKYIALVPAGDVVADMESHGKSLAAFLRGPASSRASHRYAPGKWSVKEVIGHIADAERIFAYRALRAARGDATPLASFDENAYVPAGDFDQRGLEDLVREFEAVRAASICLFASLSEATAKKVGTASNAPISVRALAYIVDGHGRHHEGILRERYL